MSLKVTEEEVGKIIEDNKRKEYTHVIWADKAEAIRRRLEDKKGLLIHNVHTNLPEGILDCIPDTKIIQEDYRAFLPAVREISIEKATRHTKTIQRVRTIEEQLLTLTQPQQTPHSPISYLSNRLTSTSIYQTPSFPRYTERQPIPASHNNTNPYVPPHRCETPLCPTTPPRQILALAAVNNPFTDNINTPRQNIAHNRLPYTPNIPSPQYR